MTTSNLLPFTKGVSGNPLGSTSRLQKLSRDMREQCAEIAFGALGIMASIVYDPTEKGSTRVAAWNSIADRGLGKALQTIALDNDAENKSANMLTKHEMDRYLANDAITTFISMYERGEPALLEALRNVPQKPEQNDPSNKADNCDGGKKDQEQE